MNTTHLHYFINVAQTRSIRKAAQLCGTSPSTISSALKELTETMVVPLYKKTSFGIELTKEGCTFYDTAQKIITELEQCKYYFQCKKHHLAGTLHLCAIPGIMSYIMPPVFNTLMSLRKDFDATFHTFTIEELLNRINCFQEDIGYINLSEDEFEYYEEKYPDLIFQKYIACQSVFLTNKNHPLAKKITVKANDLSQYPIIVYVHNDITDNPFMKKGIYNNLQFTHNENYSAELIKEDYNYLTVVPYLNGKIQHEFFDVHSHVLLFPSIEYVYYVTCVYHKNSPNQDLINEYLKFTELFY